MTDSVEERLEKRLARERRAREEAEQINERTLRRLYLSDRNHQLLARVAAVANEANAGNKALQDALPILVELGPWDLGLVFRIDAEKKNDTGPHLRNVYTFGDADLQQTR